MKVLWFTTYSNCSYTNHSLYNGGGWQTSLESLMSKVDGIELAVSFFIDEQQVETQEKGIIYFPMSKPKASFRHKLRSRIMISDKNVDSYLWEDYVSSMKQVIEKWHPDIVQVFGSENYMGLIASETSVPVILYLQGILNSCCNAFFPPFVSSFSYFFMDCNPLKIYSRFMDIVYLRRNCLRESEIIRRNKNFIGRTSWDRKVLSVMNKKASYYIVNEVLRPPFYEASKREIPSRLTIISTISKSIYKGFDLVLKTANILKNTMKVDFIWKLYGNVESVFLEKKCNLKHDELNIKLCGIATPSELKNALLNSTIYFHPSYIENSSNSICEAQLLGIPVIAVNVGGVVSLVEDKYNGYLIPSNDPYQAAFYVNKLGMDIECNIKMGNYAQIIAKKRHDRKQIISDLISAYRHVIKSTAVENI